MKRNKKMVVISTLITVVLVAVLISVLTITAFGAATVDYQIQSDWGSGAIVNVTIDNTSSSQVDDWKVTWTFPGNQKIVSMWNSNYTQSGSSVEVTGSGWNSVIPGNGSVSFGFQVNYSGTNSIPSDIKVNGSEATETTPTPATTEVEVTAVVTSIPTTDVSTPTPQTTSADPGNVDTDSLIGFASLNGGTTGGAGGTSVTCSTGTEIINAIKNKGSSPLTIYVDGKITQSNSSDSTISVKEVDDVSIIGVGNKGEFDGIGIKVWKASNVILKNLKIHHVSEGNKDCIGVEGPASNVWIDHCELYNSLDSDKDYYDGLLDVKGDSEYVTISWNYLHDSWKTSLVGSSDSDVYDRKITYHHNKIENCNSRLPSYRGGTGHIYNNYYLNNVESGINSRMGAKLRIEGNYFQNIIEPITYLYSDEAGYWDVKDNIFDNCSGSQPTSSTGSFNPPYSYDLDPASSVISIVNANVGINGSTSTGENTTPTVTATPVTNTPVNTSSPVATSNPSTGSGIVHNFTTDGLSSDVFNISGNLSTSKGTVNYNGLVLTQCLKIESSTIIDFSTSSNETLTMVFNDGDNSKIKVDGKDYTMSDGILTVELSSGSHTIRKNNSCNLYYMEMSGGSTNPVNTPANTSTPTTAAPVNTPINNTPSEGDITVSSSSELLSALKSVQAGNAIYLKSGNYSFSDTIVIEEGNKGSSGKFKRLVGQGSAVIDFSSMEENSANRGLVLDGSYWEINNVTIKGAGDNGLLLSGDNNIIDGCTFRENHDTGLQLSRFNTSYNSISQWPSNNLIKNCLSTENIDSGREDADGYAPKLTSGTGNVFESCKAIYNCDDGWDMYTKSDTGAVGVVILRDCEARGNGKFANGNSTNGDGNGYKLGDDTASVPHELYNCEANDNRKHGFTGNGNPARIILKNCGGSGNGEKLFDRLDNAQIS